MASNAENVSIWWRHHVQGCFIGTEAIMPQCLWCNPKKYGQNWTTLNHNNKAGTFCIFLYIYMIYLDNTAVWQALKDGCSIIMGLSMAPLCPPPLLPVDVSVSRTGQISVMGTGVDYSWSHNSIKTWRCFLNYWPCLWGDHQLLVCSLHKGPVMLSFDVSFHINLEAHEQIVMFPVI